MSVRENKRRADAAANVVANYSTIDELDIESGITDLLADLRHLCDRKELEFGKLDRSAYLHYLEELSDGEP